MLQKTQKKLSLSFSFLKGPNYKIAFRRREAKPRALAIEDHIIQNGEVVVITTSRAVDYSVIVPFIREYNITSGEDILYSLINGTMTL